MPNIAGQIIQVHNITQKMTITDTELSYNRRERHIDDSYIDIMQGGDDKKMSANTPLAIVKINWVRFQESKNALKIVGHPEEDAVIPPRHKGSKRNPDSAIFCTLAAIVDICPQGDLDILHHIPDSPRLNNP